MGDVTDSRNAGDRSERERARRLADVFGAVLPETTSDERVTDSAADSERWYRENRPPHHE